MKAISLIGISMLFIVFSNVAKANSVDDVRSAQRIVVLDDSEGIVFSNFCGFYELRALVVKGLRGAVGDDTGLSNPLYELRILGRFGETIVYIGDHWIKSQDGASSLSDATFERIVELVSRRKGQGIPLSKVDSVNARAIRQFNRSDYKEDNRCLQ